MIAIDTNILLYAHREDAEWHEAAYDVVAEIADSRQAWAIPWPCIHEFLAIATHRRIYSPPTPLPAAFAQVEAWLESPTVVLLAESPHYWPVLREQIEAGRVAGPEIHDARIAALCIEHGISEIWTADRDFNRFPGLTVRNPLVD